MCDIPGTFLENMTKPADTRITYQPQKKGSKFPNLQFLIRRHVFQIGGQPSRVWFVGRNIEWGDFTSILSCWTGGRIGMTPNSKSNLSNTRMFPDSMLEGAELANRVTETAEAEVESALKEMDS